MNKREVWIRGEVAAKRYLEDKGYRILSENYAGKMGEIDLIARDGEVLVFVEVKARESTAYGEPIEAVTPQKVRKIALTAKEYLLRNRALEADTRFDVIEVIGDVIRHTENAFTLNDAAYSRKH